MPELGRSADSRAELDAIRRRLQELAPPGPVGIGALTAGAAPVAGAVVLLLVTLALALSVDTSGVRVAVLVVGLFVTAAAAVIGTATLRRWLRGTAARRTEKQALLNRFQQLTVESGRPAPPPALATPAWPGPNERFRMVVGVVLAGAILVSIAATVFIRVL